MNYANIKWADVANGPGVRVSLFVSGCTHHCPGCFNSEAWSFDYGKPFTQAEEDRVVQALSSPYIQGLTLLGGEPFEPENQQRLLPLLRRVRREVPEKSIWCYSGYTLDGQLWRDSRARCQYTDEMLSLLDVLVDGRFVQAKKALDLRFRGSSNQRIIDVPRSLAAGQVVLWAGESAIRSIT